ncbi:PP0621 family protein [Rivibacter subsaxonicus]|uniref:MYND finger n=1 Tax=Rivibacter subsaxonicus TaxID=457575 RepID=A0A4V2FSP8_9BURK|nr:PP0621 family protein [Rivibacter subsaxonicus]RZT95065.1 uncharacterized protein EV670_2813 [Rivibacter subsaxonicus]
MVVRLLLILVLVLVVLGWLRSRKASRASAKPKAAERAAAPTDAAAAQPVLPCAFCGAYLPRADALPGRGGALYCSEAHRREAGDV